MAASLAYNGIATLIFDPVDQGERIQRPDITPELWGVYGHTMIGVGSILLAQNTARIEISDAMRAIDYLQTRPEVNPDKIGVMGHSGGGTQTAYIMALDKRIKAASPACYITDFYRIGAGTSDAEQNIFGQVDFGMHHGDYLVMQAPLPILINCATKDFFDVPGTWDVFRMAKRLYSTIGFPNHIDIIEDNVPHSLRKNHRQGALRWMLRWLADKDTDIIEPEIQPFTEEELYCTPNGKIMELPNAVNAYELNRQTEKTFAINRKKIWQTSDTKTLTDNIRKITGIKPIAQIPQLGAKITENKKLENLNLKKIIFNADPPVVLPALLFEPAENAQSIVLYINEEGKTAAAENGTLQKIAADGKIVLAIDIRGTGETFQTKGAKFWKQHFGIDGQVTCIAYLLGENIVAKRTHDILAAAKWLSDKYHKPIELVSIGNVGVPALHAAALEPEVFEKVTVKNCLNNYSEIIASGLNYNQFVNVIHGVLKTYDLENLRQLIGDKLSFTEPANAMSKPVNRP
jgi:hypothetical protein